LLIRCPLIPDLHPLIRTIMSNHKPLNCGVLLGEQYDPAGLTGDHEQSRCSGRSKSLES
jgi:hypothetical protein